MPSSYLIKSRAVRIFPTSIVSKTSFPSPIHSPSKKGTPILSSPYDSQSFRWHWTIFGIDYPSVFINLSAKCHSTFMSIESLT